MRGTLLGLYALLASPCTTGIGPRTVRGQADLRLTACNAAVADQHRGSWFYIADDDQTSKSTFSPLNFLFSLQSAPGQGKSPLLMLRVR